MHNILERLFRLQEKGTSVKTELLAGVTTFIALAYIMLLILIFWRMQESLRKRPALPRFGSRHYQAWLWEFARIIR